MAIGITYGLVRYQSIALKVVLDASPEGVSNFSLRSDSGFNALTAKGPLATFLSTPHLAGTAAETAFRLIGGQIEVRQTTGSATDVTSVVWAGGGLPSLVFTNGGLIVDQEFEVRIVIPHSIVQ